VQPSGLVQTPSTYFPPDNVSYAAALRSVQRLDGWFGLPLLWLEFGKDAKWQSGYDSGHSTKTLIGLCVPVETCGTSAGVLSSRQRDY